MEILKKIKTAAPTIVETEIIESISASSPDAKRESELTFFPIFLNAIPSRVFTTTETAIIISTTLLYSGIIGLKIFLMDSPQAVIPA